MPPFFFLMIRRPPRSPLFPTRRSSDLFVEFYGAGLSQMSLPDRGTCWPPSPDRDRKSTRLNSRHGHIHYAPFFFFNDPAPTEISPLSYTTLFRSVRGVLWRRPLANVSSRSGDMLATVARSRSEEHTAELPSRPHPLCPLFFF